jgi:GNAT superfamily N-acetyltransferase
VIRQATTEDTDEIARVLRESFAEYESLYTPQAYIATTPASAMVRERLGEGPIWIAVEDGATIGTISVRLTPEGVYVRGMAIVPTARGTGIAESLLREVEEFVLSSAARRLYLSTTPFLTRAIRFYERHGFRRCEGGPSNLHGTPLFTMEKAV